MNKSGIDIHNKYFFDFRGKELTEYIIIFNFEFLN